MVSKTKHGVIFGIDVKVQHPQTQSERVLPHGSQHKTQINYEMSHEYDELQATRNTEEESSTWPRYARQGKGSNHTKTDLS